MTNEQRLRAFAQAILKGWPDFDTYDGFDLQELATTHGLLAPIQVTEPCGEDCNCAEYGDFPTDCYRFTPLLTGEP